MEIWNYGQVLDEIDEEINKKRAHLLLGNGFSRAFADHIFNYKSLYEVAKKKGLTEKAIAVFEKMSETNFEKVLRTYDECMWMAAHYGQQIDDSILTDRDSLRNILIDVISEKHPKNKNELQTETINNGINFIRPYHNIFTCNYDLVLYWLVTEFSERWKDGFRRPGGILSFVGFEKAPNMYYLHGALHLVRKDNHMTKLTWNGSGPLKEQITNSINDGFYPVFVSEGDFAKKKNHIENDHYLNACLQALRGIEGVLVVFGLSLNPLFDQHIIDAIKSAPGLQKIYFGVFGDTGWWDIVPFLQYAKGVGLLERIQLFQSRSVSL